MSLIDSSASLSNGEMRNCEFVRGKNEKLTKIATLFSLKFEF